MFKIKSHHRYKSQDHLLYTKDKSDEIKESFFVKENLKNTKNTPEKSPQIIPKINNLQQKSHKRQLLSNRNSLDNLRSDRCKVENQVNFQSELKKLQKNIQELTLKLSEISKQLNHQLYKKKVLANVISLINIQSSYNMSENRRQKTNQLTQQFLEITKQKSSIEKIEKEINKVKGLNKNLLQEIQNQRKNRSIYEIHFSIIEKEIRSQQNIYTSLLMKSIDNKFLYMMTAANDVMTNGHVISLKKQNEEENEKQLTRNAYLCMPTAKSSAKQIQNQSFRKSSKCIGKKDTLKKLAKIISFVESSKALQQSEMQLYNQQELLENYSSKGKVSLSFFNLKNPNISKSNIKNKKIMKKGSKGNVRSGKIVSIKFFTDTSSYWEQKFEIIVYELFRLYQSLGVNIFEQNLIQEKQGENNFEDYFTFDQDKLVNESLGRLKYIEESQQKIVILNQTLENKILSAEQQIHLTQNFIDQIYKNSTQKRQKEYEQKDGNAISQEQLENLKIFQELSEILNLDINSFNIEKDVEKLIQELTKTQMQKKQVQFNKTLDQNTVRFQTKKQTFFSIEDQQKQKKRNNYVKSIAKTQGSQKKFHRLINDKDETNMSKASISISCRSIYENGIKSLNNIFDNMKTVQSYQRAFEREEFQKQYSKEITKKKRVMFRRQAKVLPNEINE